MDIAEKRQIWVEYLLEGMNDETKEALLKALTEDVDKPERSILKQQWRYDIRHIDPDSLGGGVWDRKSLTYVDLNDWKEEIAAFPDVLRAATKIVKKFSLTTSIFDLQDEVVNLRQALKKAC